MATQETKFETSAIKLYWWNQLPNFGDAISQRIVEFVSGRTVIWSKPDECDLFALGSVMTFARRAYAFPNPEHKPWIWGTGSVGPHRKDFVNNVRFALVRGPLTETLLGLDMDSYGDPGLLISNALDEIIEKQEYIGIVPHHSQVSSPKITELIERDPRLKLIDVRSNDAIQVVREIASCRFILSSSLHGLIVADSYGIPNTWLRPTHIHKTPKFKFYDYALSVQRDLPQPVRLEEVSTFVDNLQHYEIDYHEGILASKRALIDSFPPELKVRPQN